MRRVLRMAFPQRRPFVQRISAFLQNYVVPRAPEIAPDTRSGPQSNGFPRLSEAIAKSKAGSEGEQTDEKSSNKTNREYISEFEIAGLSNVYVWRTKDLAVAQNSELLPQGIVNAMETEHVFFFSGKKGHKDYGKHGVVATAQELIQAGFTRPERQPECLVGPSLPSSVGRWTTFKD